MTTAATVFVVGGVLFPGWPDSPTPPSAAGGLTRPPSATCTPPVDARSAGSGDHYEGRRPRLSGLGGDVAGDNKYPGRRCGDRCGGQGGGQGGSIGGRGGAVGGRGGGRCSGDVADAAAGGGRGGSLGGEGGGGRRAGACPGPAVALPAVVATARAPGAAAGAATAAAAASVDVVEAAAALAAAAPATRCGPSARRMPPPPSPPPTTTPTRCCHLQRNGCYCGCASAPTLSARREQLAALAASADGQDLVFRFTRPGVREVRVRAV